MQPIDRVEDLFRHQRAVRAFADRAVDDATVERVLAAATHAPSGSNTQPWRFIVVRDREVKSRLAAEYEAALADAYGSSSGAAGAARGAASAAAGAGGGAPARASWVDVPVLIVACVQAPANGHAGLQTGASIYPACQNLMLQARALGLGSVLTTLHRRRRAAIHAILGVPAGYDTAAIIPLGWPDRAYGPNHRPPPAAVTMRDRWDPSLA